MLHLLVVFYNRTAVTRSVFLYNENLFCMFVVHGHQLIFSQEGLLSYPQSYTFGQNVR